MYPEEERALQERYEHALRALAELDDGTTRFLKFKDGILSACENARNYTRDDDWNEKERKRDADFLKSRKYLVAAAKKLKNSFQRYPLQTRGTLLQAHMGFRYGNLIGSDVFGTGSQQIEERFGKLLDAYIDTVGNDPFAKKGEYMHRFMVGPLVYKDVVDKHSARIDPSVTGLIFQLVLYMRRFTNGEPEPIKLSICEPMPNYGKPRYNIVCDFVNAALKKKYDEYGVRQRLVNLIADNFGIAFFDWPQNIAP